MRNALRVTRVIGLTGGIGTGKSTVARLFAKLGAVVIDADAIVHELQAPGMPMLEVISEAFGPEMIRPDGSLDRERLGQHVFGDAEALARLNQIVHPAVGAEMARRLSDAQTAGTELVLLDIPLLFEGRARAAANPDAKRPRSSGDGVEAVILVYATPAQQIERQIARDGVTEELARQRLDAQLPIDEKRAMADHVIENSGSLEETEAQVGALYAKLAGA